MLTYKHTKLACYLGYITQGIINNFIPLLFVIFQDSFVLSYEMLGRLVVMNFGTQMIVDMVAVKFVDKIGYRPCIFVAHLFSFLGLAFLGFLPNVMSPYAGLSIAVITYAIGGGIIEVLISPIIEAIPSDDKSSQMSLLHSFYCWGQVGVIIATTLLIRFLGSENWNIVAFIWAAFPLLNAFFFLKVPIRSVTPEEGGMPIRKLFSTKLFIMMMLLMFSAGASELAMAQWASFFAQKGLGVNKLVGDLIGPCLFGVLMGVGRVFYGIKGEKMDLKKMLLGCSILCIGCYLVTSMVNNPIVSLVSCALCGLSVSLMWPGVISLSSERFKDGGTPMFGILAMSGDIGCSFGPWFFGMISDFSSKNIPSLSDENSSLKFAFLLCCIFPLIMLLGVLALRKKKTND